MTLFDWSNGKKILKFYIYNFIYIIRIYIFLVSINLYCTNIELTKSTTILFIIYSNKILECFFLFFFFLRQSMFPWFSIVNNIDFLESEDMNDNKINNNNNLYDTLSFFLFSWKNWKRSIRLTIYNKLEHPVWQAHRITKCYFFIFLFTRRSK